MRVGIFILFVWALTGCGGSDDSRLTGCLAEGGRQQLAGIMQDWYFWNDETAQLNKYNNLNPNRYSDAEALLDFLRYQPAQFDRYFSYITTPQEEQAFYNEGEFVGFGVSLARIGNSSDIRVTQVYANSPAAAAGFERGFRLWRINGRTISQIDFNEGVNAALGPADVGVTRTLTMLDRTGNELPPVSLTKAVVSIDPVPIVNIIEDDLGNPVAGYIFLRTFINTAMPDLRAAFALFAQEQVGSVIVDLRYNGGGLISVAEVFADLLAGPGNVDNVFYELQHNSARAAQNFIDNFGSETNAINLDKVIFITGNGSASASELLINGLAPYFAGGDKDIAVVGSPSYGKPVGQYAFDFCAGEYRLRAVSFKIANVLGEGDYFNGLPVDCPAADGLLSPLGNQNEAALSAALDYLQNGSCGAGVAIARSADGVTDKAAVVNMITGGKVWQREAGAF